VTWHCRACGQVGRVLQVANLQPDPVPAPVLEPEPEESAQDLLGRVTSGVWAPEPAPAAVGLLESLRDAWTGEDSTDRAAAAAGVPRDLLESVESAADQVARETRTPRKGDR